MIPYGVSAYLTVFSNYFKLYDSAGSQVARSPTTMPLLIPPGGQSPLVRLKVIGVGQ